MKLCLYAGYLTDKCRPKSPAQQKGLGSLKGALWGGSLGPCEHGGNPGGVTGLKGCWRFCVATCGLWNRFATAGGTFVQDPQAALTCCLTCWGQSCAETGKL